MKSATKLDLYKNLFFNGGFNADDIEINWREDFAKALETAKCLSEFLSRDANIIFLNHINKSCSVKEWQLNLILSRAYIELSRFTKDKPDLVASVANLFANFPALKKFLPALFEGEWNENNCLLVAKIYWSVLTELRKYSDPICALGGVFVCNNRYDNRRSVW